VNVAASSVLLISTIHIENHDRSEQLEFDEDLTSSVKIYETIAELYSSKFGAINLDLPGADLAPLFPPPKPC
jgi:hypothetical protein